MPTNVALNRRCYQDGHNFDRFLKNYFNLVLERVPASSVALAWLEKQGVTVNGYFQK
jgi:hypothetical protein